METADKLTVGDATPLKGRHKLSLCFACGFLVVFVAMLLLVRMTAMHPSGQYAVQYPLWQYYADGLPRLFRPSTLGPASGGSSQLVVTGLLHLLCSVVGGGAAIAVGWCVGKFQSGRARGRE